ncbi:MAG: hypothetical protein V2J51_01040 [Erythrobacter sp.]|jgi:hypothetical protein|nr:hypothetical protein [Erythrobacter sp.]
MKKLTSTKLRAIGGASVLALSAGVTAPVFAQEAGEEDGATAPTPTAPDVPTNTQECAVSDGNVVVCEPGVDTDGIFFAATGDSNMDDSDGDDSDTDTDGFGGDVGLDIQSGAYVQGAVTLLADVEGTIDGAIVTTGDGEGALLLDAGSNVTNNGFIQTDGEGSVAVEVTSDGAITNTGTIYTTGDDGADGVVLGENSTLTNSGLIQTDGEDVSAVLANSDGVTVINTADGEIVTTGDLSNGVELLDGATLDNAGLIRTFGETSQGVVAGEGATITNSGTVSTLAGGSAGILGLDGSTINNSGTIESTGFTSVAVAIAGDGTIANIAGGTISASNGEGDIEDGETPVVATFILGEGTLNNAGTIEANGDGAIAALVGEGSTVINSGSITADGDTAIGITAGLDTSVTNSGSITATGEDAVAIIANGGTITNEAGGTISGTVGISSAQFDAANTVANFGSITGTGGTAVRLGAGDDQFQAWNTGTTTGIVAGGEGFDTLVFGNAGEEANTRNAADFTDEDQFTGFEAFAFLDQGGGIVLDGDSDESFTLLGGNLTVNGALTNTFVAGGEGAILAISDTGSIAVEEGAAFQATTDDASLSNAGTLGSDDGDVVEAIGVDGFTLDNSGTIAAVSDGSVGVVAVGEDFAINNTIDGVISAAGDGANAVFAEGSGVIDNDGSIETAGDGSAALLLVGDVELVNSGTVSANSDGEGEGGIGVLLDGGADVTNEAGGSITGDIAILAIGADNEDDDASNTVANFGSLTGTSGLAVDLGEGDDFFQVWDDSTVDGTVDGGEGTDSLVFGNTGADPFSRDVTDFAIDDQFVNFETIGFADGGGGTVLDGDSDQSFSIFGGNVTVGGNLSGTVVVEADGSVLGVAEGASIDVEDAAAIQVNGNSVTIDNDGTVRSGSANTIDGFGSDLTVDNSGDIQSEGDNGIAIFAADGLTLTNSGSITADDESGVGVGAIGSVAITNTADGTIAAGVGVIAEGSGTVDNDGTITSNGGLGVVLDGDATLENSGLVSAAFSDDDDDDDNDGPDGIGVQLLGDTGVTNEADGIIEGAIAVDATGDDGNNVVANFGTLTGTSGDAVLLGEGDDQFQAWNTGTIDGQVDGGDGTDLVVFGNAGADPLTRDITDFEIDDQFTNFENFGFADAGAGTFLDGDSDQSFAIVAGDVTVNGSITNTVLTLGTGHLIVADTAEIDTDGVDAVEIGSDNTSVTNNGLIRSTGERAIDGRDFDGTTIVNTGTITSTGLTIFEEEGEDTEGEDTGGEDTGGEDTGGEDTGGEDTDGEDTDTIVLTTDGNSAIDLSGSSGASIENSGNINTNVIGEKAIIAGNTTTITNLAGGVIEAFGEGSNAIEADGAGVSIVNSGTIRSDQDVAIVGGDDLTVTNNAGGLIVGDIAIDTGEGEGDGEGGANDGSQQVVNFGTIEGRDTNGDAEEVDIVAVRLGGGDDEFQQWTGATVLGDIDLGEGDDTFILEGSVSSVDGDIIGGDGTDTAILAGTLDEEDFGGFELFQLGSQLGGTLNDLDIDGDRVLDGDVVHVGIVNLDLGVDSLTATGTITLEETGVLNIGTPRDRELLGQTIRVFEAQGVFDDDDDDDDNDTGFRNNGATVNILDNDLLLDYTVVDPELSVAVSAATPFVNSTDKNLVNFGQAIRAGVEDGDLSDAAFDAINSLDENGAVAAVAGSLPSLTGAAAREIFETSNLASQAMDRHVTGEDSGIWGQVAVRGAEQDGRSQTVAGYESDQLIFTVGGDVALGSLRVGALASYADIENEDLDGNVSRGEQDIESIKLGAYVATGLFTQGFFNAEVAYLTGEIEDARTSVLGATASSTDFDGFTGKLTLGYDVLGDENVALVPTVGFAGARINFDDTIESGGFGFGIERDDAEFAELRGGIELSGGFTDTVRGFIQGTVIHDLIDDEEVVILTSDQLAPFTVHGFAREQDRFELAAGLSAVLGDTVEIGVGYLGDFADGYDAHSARATLRIGF